jgi:hypothetical protein
VADFTLVGTHAGGLAVAAHGREPCIMGIYMETDYIFWRELLDTYQSSNDLLKALWVVTPPAFVLLLIQQFLHHRRAVKMAAHDKAAKPDGQPLYSVNRMDNGELRVFAHAPELTEINHEALRLLMAPQESRANAESASGM